MQVPTGDGQQGQVPAERVRSEEELRATEVQQVIFLQLWSAKAVSNSPLNPSIQRGTGREYQAAVFHL